MINVFCLLVAVGSAWTSKITPDWSRLSCWYVTVTVGLVICFRCVKHKNSIRIWNIFLDAARRGKVSVWNGVAAVSRVEQIHGPPRESTNQTRMLVFFVSWLMIKMTWLYPKPSWWLLSNMHAYCSSIPHIPLHSQTVAVKNWSSKPFCDWFMFITLHFSTVNAAETVSLCCIL